MKKETLIEKARKHSLQGAVEFLKTASKKMDDPFLLSMYERLKNILDNRNRLSSKDIRLTVLFALEEMTLEDRAYLSDGGDAALFFVWLYVSYEKILIEGI